jgi:phosphonate transport system permease protein
MGTNSPSSTRIAFGFAMRPSVAGGWIAVSIGAAAMAALIFWSARGSELSWEELAKGAPWLKDFVGRMLPPKWEYLPKLVSPALQTIQIALSGTVLAVLLALPVSFFAARNVAPNSIVHFVLRQLLNFVRGINELILALIFVAAVGLGPFPGVLALAVHGAGMLGKFYADAIEEIDPGPVDALRATGAAPMQVIAFAVVPQALPAWISATLYRLEANLRQATILGMVGAGGIGFELVASMKLFQYQETAACIVVIMVMVMGADFIASRLRHMIVGRSGSRR